MNKVYLGDSTYIVMDDGHAELYGRDGDVIVIHNNVAINLIKYLEENFQLEKVNHERF